MMTEELADKVMDTVTERIASEFGGFWTKEDLLEVVPGMVREAVIAATRPDPRDEVIAELVEALLEARRIITEIDDYMKRPERGDWGVECALCMGELLDDDRQAIAHIDSALTKHKGTSHER